MNEIDEKIKKFKKINFKDISILLILIIIFIAVVYFISPKKQNQETLFKYEIKVLVKGEKSPDIKFINEGDTEIYNGKVRAVVKNTHIIQNLYDNETYFQVELYVLVNRKKGEYWYVDVQKFAKENNITISINNHNFTGEVVYAHIVK